MTWPFENNTNAITGKLAKRSLQADKRRNIFLIVTITLTTALLSGIFFTVFAEQRKMLSDLRGQYQTVVMETTQKEIEHLSTQPEIEQWGLSKDFESARYQDSTLAVEYADKGWMKLGKRPSYVGNFPEKEQEIIVEQAFLDYFGLPQETGQTIRLNLGNEDQDYIISGILQKENNSRMFSVIVSKAFLEAQAKGEPLYEFRFRFVGADRTDMDALKSDIAAFLADHNIPENRIFYSSNYFDIRSFQSDGVYACIPIALILLAACGLVIYSIFFISIRGKLREYGRLKVLGTTPKQIRKIIHRESFRLSICSIPIGIASGGAAGFAASPGYWDWTENIIIALGVMFFIEFIVRISSYAPIRLAAKVSPIEAVRASGYQAEGSKKTSRKSGKHLSPNYLAVMNFRRNPKKAVLTLLSLGMAGVFLFSTATVVHISIFCDENYTDSVKDRLTSLISGNPNLQLKVYSEEYSMIARFVNVTMSSLYAISAFVVIFGLLNMVNMLINSAIIRKREFALLQAVGMTNRQLRKMLYREGMNVSTKSVLLAAVFGITIGGILCYLANKVVALKFVIFTIVPLPVLLFAAVLIGLQLLVSYCICRSIEKTSLIENLRME